VTAPAPGRYRHFKGGEYVVLGTALHTDGGETVVVYRNDAGDLFVRPLSLWLATAYVQGNPMHPTQRFAPLDAAPRRPRVYIASKTCHAHDWRALRASLAGSVQIVCSWIDEAGPGESADLADLWRRCIGEAVNADALIVYGHHTGSKLRGALVEVGAALAAGRPVIQVGTCDSFDGASFVHHPLYHVADGWTHAWGMIYRLTGLTPPTPAMHLFRRAGDVAVAACGADGPTSKTTDPTLVTCDACVARLGQA
jgi:Protein of unknown function (DUF1653)